jgi:3-deoxy-D-arabino-heptulosonate 7-phosphate (DAHP) synthase class II
VSKYQFERGPALKFGVTQFKEFLVLQLARVRIQTALLLSCVWCAEAFIANYKERKKENTFI